jgi:hypothetical protein
MDQGARRSAEQEAAVKDIAPLLDRLSSVGKWRAL